jgi:PDDEXK-like domain of unknown function (DUF3799)
MPDMTYLAIAGVSVPGVYEMDIDTYHTQKACAGASISSGGLRKIDRECPAKFYATSDLNPKAFPGKDTKSLSFGRAAHCLMLGEPEFDKKFIISPFDNFTTKEARAWRDSQQRQIVKLGEMSVINDMVAAQKASSDVSRAFTHGAPEKSLIWKDEETGVWLKSRPDWLPTKPEDRLIAEYKTADSIKPSLLSAAAFNYGYEMQAALLLDGVQATMGVIPSGVAFIVQEKEPPYLVEARIFTPEQVDFGRMQYRRALRIFADCLQTGVWPSYSEGPAYFQTPYWVAKAMETWDDGTDRSSTAEGYTAADYLGAG